MGQPMQLKAAYQHMLGQTGGNILVPPGRERKIDSLSSGERKGKSPNRRRYGAGGVVGVIMNVQRRTGTYWKVRP